MSGTITRFQRDRGGVGTLLGDDRKSYVSTSDNLRPCVGPGQRAEFSREHIGDLRAIFGSEVAVKGLYSILSAIPERCQHHAS